MSYISNLNKIDHQLKQVFETVKIDKNDYRMLNIRVSTPINENINSKLELGLFVNQSNLNTEDPVIEWGYYTNPNDITNSIKFKNNINGLSGVIESIVTQNRLDESYLESIKEYETINESVSTEEEDPIENINETYKLTEGNLDINETKLKSYLKKYGVVVENIKISYRDVNSGMLRKPSFVSANNGQRGDESEIVLEGISSANGINPSTWVKLEQDIRKIPFVEDVKSSASQNSVDFSFSTKVFVEIK